MGVEENRSPMTGSAISVSQEPVAWVRMFVILLHSFQEPESPGDSTISTLAHPCLERNPASAPERGEGQKRLRCPCSCQVQRRVAFRGARSFRALVVDRDQDSGPRRRTERDATAWHSVRELRSIEGTSSYHWFSLAKVVLSNSLHSHVLMIIGGFESGYQGLFRLVDVRPGGLSACTRCC